MGYKVVRTDLYQRDLDSVIGYLVLALENRPAAVSLLDSVEECYADLERTPFMYEECHNTHLHELGYRRAVIRNYIMVYKVDETARQVTILRLFYGKQDYEKLI